MKVYSYLDQASETFSHILVDEQSLQCLIVDPVLGFDEKSGCTNTVRADELIAEITKNQWQLIYIIETHAHADHLSSATYIKELLGGQTIMGKHITQVQKVFKAVYNFDNGFKTDASQFDLLAEEGSTFVLGNIEIHALYVPGHTPADMAYMAKNTSDPSQPMVVFVGDTMFAPDVGTARCDFPGGDAVALYNSIQRLLSLPDDTLLYLCHDYPPKGRDHRSNVSVREQQQSNKHVRQGISEAEFVAMRETRDSTLSMPKLIIPAVQVNVQAGKLPDPENNGVRYLKIPLNAL